MRGANKAILRAICHCRGGILVCWGVRGEKGKFIIKGEWVFYCVNYLVINAIKCLVNIFGKIYLECCRFVCYICFVNRLI